MSNILEKFCIIAPFIWLFNHASIMEITSITVVIKCLVLNSMGFCKLRTVLWPHTIQILSHKKHESL